MQAHDLDGPSTDASSAPYLYRSPSYTSAASSLKIMYADARTPRTPGLTEDSALLVGSNGGVEEQHGIDYGSAAKGPVQGM